MEYFDDTLKTQKKLVKYGIPALGMMPKMILDPEMLIYHSFKRLIAIITQNILQYFGSQPDVKSPKTIVVFSTQSMEGKTVIAGNIAKTLKQEGKRY
jgi:Mrp family chromosome partitioning ATPase